MPLDPAYTDLATAPHLGVLTTLNADGAPVAQPVWVDNDGEHVLINTERDRRKTRNVRRDPRIVLVIVDADDDQHYVEIRGRVVEVVEGEQAVEHAHRLSQKYTGHDHDMTHVRSPRVILKITPNLS